MRHCATCGRVGGREGGRGGGGEGESGRERERGGSVMNNGL